VVIEGDSKGAALTVSVAAFARNGSCGVVTNTVTARRVRAMVAGGRVTAEGTAADNSPILEP